MSLKRGAPASGFKISKVGSWQPYVPKIGVAVGCRTGSRNALESFNIQHLSNQKYQDTTCFPDKDCSAPSSRTSFEGGSILLSASNQAERLGRRPGDRNTSSLKQGLIPLADECRSVSRLHCGKITRESLCVWNDTESNNGMASVKVRCDLNSLKPPNNLGAGLEPHVDSFMDERRKIKLLDCKPKQSGLGAGLIPLPGKNGLDIPQPPPVASLAQEYSRVYGALK